MTHHASHVRQSFLDWVEAGFPEFATVERQYIQTQVPAEEMLRRFIAPMPCSDRPPREVNEAVARHLGINPSPVMSYAAAAILLLAHRATPAGTPALIAALFPEVTE